MTRGGLSGRLLESVLDEARIALRPGAVGDLLAHAQEMLRWNRAIRLTAVTDPVEVAVKHVADSLFLLRFAPFPGLTMDFGSGAGFPGIPLAIALPEARLVLVESSAKKCAFLSRVRSLLGLSNVEVVRRRIAAGGRDEIGAFDRIVTRATLPPGEAAALLLPHLAPGGRLLVMAGPGGEPASGRGPGGRRAPAAAGIVPVRRETFSLPRKMGERVVLEYAAGPVA